MKVKKINFSLGELEREIMELVWKYQESSVREVLSALQKKRHIAYTTVMTIMSRLADNGLLQRRLEESGAYSYTSVYDKQKYLAVVSKKTVDGLIKDYGELAVAQFIDAVESSNLKNLKEWQRKLKNI